jgi:hypothetical protein
LLGGSRNNTTGATTARALAARSLAAARLAARSLAAGRLAASFLAAAFAATTFAAAARFAATFTATTGFRISGEANHAHGHYGKHNGTNHLISPLRLGNPQKTFHAHVPPSKH